MINSLKNYQSSTYIVHKDRIAYIEGESIVSNVVRGYDTIWAYYHENEKNNITTASLEANVGININCGTFSYGFGNKDTDAIAYRAAGVPLNKIFIINTESRIFVYNNTYAKSYTQLDEIVYEMFPPVTDQEDVADYEYSALNYWKPDYLPLLDDDI